MTDSNTPFGSLTLEPLSKADLQIFYDQDTPLGELKYDNSESHYIFATDESGLIVGLISREEIHARLQSKNDRERARWAEMPLSFLVTVPFPTDAGISVESFAAVATRTGLFEQQSPAGILTDRDVFLSWERLLSLFSRAMSDPLTGLPNRLAYERRLHEEWNRSLRTNSSIGIVVVDLDFFKQTNDRFGHAVGDAVLCEVAQRLEMSLRSYDLVVRFGGDEFIALCLGCQPGEISIPVGRILEHLAGSDLAVDGEIIPISASIGAAIRHDDFCHFRPKDLFAAADECLYKAKNERGTACFVEFESNSTNFQTVKIAEEENIKSVVT